MADDGDLAALHAGEIDLVQADFRGANLVGADLKNRDFTRAQFDKADIANADFSGSTLTKATFSQSRARHAKFINCVAVGTGFVHVDFTEADFQSANFQRSIFHTCKFIGANFNGADFTKTQLIHDNVLDDSKSDEMTRFDGARILRPQIGLPVFRYYRLERGELFRLDVVSPQNNVQPVSRKANGAAENDAVLPVLEAAEEALRDLRAVLPATVGHGTIGHNAPPIEFALGPEELDSVAVSLELVRSQISSPSPDVKVIRKAGIKIRAFAAQVIHWAAAKANLFADEFVKSIGKEAGSPTGLLAISLVVSGRWTALADALLNNFG